MGEHCFEDPISYARYEDLLSCEEAELRLQLETAVNRSETGRGICRLIAAYMEWKEFDETRKLLQAYDNGVIEQARGRIDATRFVKELFKSLSEKPEE